MRDSAADNWMDSGTGDREERVNEVQQYSNTDTHSLVA